MPKSHGERRKTRYKLKKAIRQRGVAPVSHALKSFNSGQKVHIDLDPSVHKGMPNPKFHGKTGTVVEQRGRAYVIEVTDGNAVKTILARPQHLKAQK
ncbi:MAG TPA: 50S ribosomal protein L21e [Candidatus Acidoferrales bacterium]|nr:50S ribosomal protein L21e [Candidatus Acidoferrales bacterium]